MSDSPNFLTTMGRRLRDFLAHYFVEVVVFIAVFAVINLFGRPHDATVFTQFLHALYHASIAALLAFAYHYFVRRIARSVARTLADTEAFRLLGTLRTSIQGLTTSLDQNRTQADALLSHVRHLVPYADSIERLHTVPAFGDVLTGVSSMTASPAKEALARAFLADLAQLLHKDKCVLSLDGYLHWLTAMMQGHAQLVCINRTLPVFWFSPTFEEERWVQRYFQLISARALAVKRLTIVDRVNELSSQFEDAWHRFDKGTPERKTIWALRLLSCMQAMWAGTEDPCSAARATDIVKRALSADLCATLKPVFEPEPWSANADGPDIAVLLRQAIAVQQNVPELVVKAIDEIVADTTLLADVNADINRLFLRHMDTEGSLYLSSPRLTDLCREKGFPITPVGELGVFLDATKTPTLAFHAIGGPSSAVRIELLDGAVVRAFLDDVLGEVVGALDKPTFRTLHGCIGS